LRIIGGGSVPKGDIINWLSSRDDATGGADVFFSNSFFTVVLIAI